MADQKKLKDYATPLTQGLQSGILRPAIESNNFEIKPALLNLVQQNQFSGLAAEDPSLHLNMFLEHCDTFKINGVSPDALRLRLFPFSLRDKARAWLYTLPPVSITTWDELSRIFLCKFFPPAKTAHIRNQIASFAQQGGESLYDAWERYKDLLIKCPHHGLEKWLVVQTFYNGLNYNARMTVDAAAGGALMNKSVDEAYDLIEGMTQNYTQWGTERAATGTLNNREVSVMAQLAEQVSFLADKLKNLDTPVKNQVNAVTPICDICGIQGHLGHECQFNQSVEQVNAFQGAQQRQGNPFSNTYNPGWRNHPNFAWNGQNQQQQQNPHHQSPNFQAQRPPYQQQFQQQQQQPPPYKPPHQRQPEQSNLERMMANFIANQEKKEAAMNQKFDSFTTHIRMLETQIAQLASPAPNNTNPLPAQPINPRTNNEQINAISCANPLEKSNAVIL